MKAIIKYDEDFKKWVIDVITNDGLIVPVGTIVCEDLNMFEISKWDTKELAEDWVVMKGLKLN